MSKNITFKLNLRGLNELMKSDAMQAILNEGAESMQGAAGGDYEQAHPISFIAIASVRTANDKAQRGNKKSKTLLKASGRSRV